MLNLKSGLIKLGWILLLLIVLIVAVLGLAYLAFEVRYANKIYPGIYVGGISLEGKTSAEARDVINKQLTIVNLEGVVFYYNGNEATIDPISSSSDGEIIDVLINFKVDDTISQAMAVGRGKNPAGNLKTKLSLLLNRDYPIDLIVDFDNKEIAGILKQRFSVFDPKNAAYYFDAEGNLSIKGGQAGKVLNYEEGLNALRNNLGDLNFSRIVLNGADSDPDISEDDCLIVKSGAELFLNSAQVKLEYKTKEWSVDKPALLDWVVLIKRNNNVYIGLDRERIREYLKNNVAAEIDQDPVLPKISLSDGKVDNFQPGKEGLKLDIEPLIGTLSGLLSNPTVELNLSDHVSSIPFGETQSDSNLGIKEVIGRYSLKFDGSTSARIANIRNGAKKINGLLIKSGEEFSMLNALGDIDAEHGYVKEAVIKGNSISYDFGGGLCHSSTTLFRAVLDAGLPVTMRKNHSYNMPYYEPAGVDATIFSPDPDFKFVNDTGNYLLIQATTSNRDLTIELWGAKDGRIVKRTEPVIYNIVNPRPIRYVKTSSLATGKIKCTYAAYVGADTYFDYEVTYPDGTIKKERFNSHYIPRQGVCLIGI